MKKIFTLMTFLSIIIFIAISCEVSVETSKDDDDDDDTPPAYTCNLTIDGSTLQLNTIFPADTFHGFYLFSFTDYNGHSVSIHLPMSPDSSYTGTDWTSVSDLSFYVLSSSVFYNASYDTTKNFTIYNIQVSSGIISATFSGNLSNSSKTEVKTVSGDFSIAIEN